MWQSRLEAQCYVTRLVSNMAHAKFLYFTVRVVILYVRLFTTCCLVEEMVFGLCPMMTSHSGTKKGWIKDANILREFKQFILKLCLF